MILRWRRRVSRHAYGPLLIAGLLSACGGSAIVALVQIVTPLGGSWNVSGTDEALDLNNNPLGTVMFESSLNVTATVTTASDVCGGGLVSGGSEVDLEGTLDNGDLVLHQIGSSSTCLQGSFTDLRTLEAGPPGGSTQSYQNSRVDVQMSLGLWVSNGSSQLKLKFVGPDSVDNDVSGLSAEIVEGCDVSNPSLVVKFEGEMNGFNTITNAKPSIPVLTEISGGLTRFTDVIFEDGATLSLLNASGQPVTLHREPDTTTNCPP